MADTGRKQLIIAAVTTDICLVFPTISAVGAGYEVQAVLDASGSSFAIGEEIASRRRMERAGVWLTLNQYHGCRTGRQLGYAAGHGAGAFARRRSADAAGLLRDDGEQHFSRRNRRIRQPIDNRCRHSPALLNRRRSGRSAGDPVARVPVDRLCLARVVAPALAKAGLAVLIPDMWGQWGQRQARRQ